MKDEEKLIYEPCYQYSRESKEKFFNDPYCSFLFLIAIDHIIAEESLFNEKIIKICAKELKELALRTLQKRRK